MHEPVVAQRGRSTGCTNLEWLSEEDRLNDRDTERDEPLLGLLGAELPGDLDRHPERDATRAQRHTVAHVDEPPRQL